MGQRPGEGGGGEMTIGNMMTGLGFEESGDMNYAIAAIGALTLAQQLIDAGWKNRLNDKANFGDWMKLVDKVPELLNLYSQARSVFIPVSGDNIYYQGQQQSFSNKININTDKMGSILNYAYTIGHEMLHYFDDKYNFKKYMSLFSSDSQDFKRDRYTIPVYMLYKEYRSYNWEKSLGNDDVNVANKLEQYRIMWSLPMKTLNYLNNNIKTFSNIFINP